MIVNLRRTVLVCFSLFLVLEGSSSQEITFGEAPENYRLYARNQKDSVDVIISGRIEGEHNLEGLSLKVFKDGLPYHHKDISIIDKLFFGSTQIHAGLHQFKFELYTIENDTESLYFVADSVVCGDAYIITGQSNSHPSSIESTYSSPWCRSFGVKTGYEPYDQEDRDVRWGRATGNCQGLERGGGWFMKNRFGVGVWGMELMRLIVEQHKVPVCILNGGSGSSSVEQNLLYPEQPSLETSFGRLAYRVAQAGLKDQVKAILWHQGESNTHYEDNYKSYPSKFDGLLNDWKRVYTGLERIYVFQLHPGCGGDYQSEFREIQHQIADQYDMIEIMSTTGVSGHDGCHFSYEGYCEFAYRIFPLLSRDFYGELPEKIITPPQLVEVKYNGENEIILEFDQSIYLEESKEVNGNIHYLKDQFFFSQGDGEVQTSGRVENIEVDSNQLLLRLKEGDIFSFITYLPNRCYLDTEDVYNGPWVRGSENDLGALTFHRKAIGQASVQPE